MFRLTNYFAIPVKDYKKALDFYQNILEMNLVEDLGTESHLEKDGKHLFIDNEPSQSGKVFFEFEVEEMEKAVLTLKKNGCDITHRYSEHSIMFKDPFGMRFHLYLKGKL